MILILSEAGDITTNEVIDWLTFYDLPFFRINTEDRITIDHFSLDSRGKFDFSLRVHGSSVQLQTLTGFFYRRGSFQFNIQLPQSNDLQIQGDLRNHIRQDVMDLNAFLAFMLASGIPTIGEFRLQRVNKLIVLKTAADCGLVIPRSFLSEQAAQVESLLQSEKSLITKGISDTFSSYSFALGVSIAGFTSRVNQEDVQACNRAIAPSLFQTEIDKLLEVRSFYLHGRFYSMAIISQNNTKTKTDYRQYDSEFPNRNVPFQLPVEIEQKLDDLMHRIGLSTGSIDLIIDSSGEYIFLEVNPVGQFGALSEVCNYQLEKKIAEFFVNSTQRR